MGPFLLVILLVCICPTGIIALKIRNVHFSYPVENVDSTDGQNWKATLSRDKLSCFSNTDHDSIGFVDTLMCFIPFMSNGCEALWGSRSLVLEYSGSVEVLKLNHPVQASSEFVPINATRWLLFNAPHDKAMKEIIQIPAEPLYLCARANHWRDESSQISFNFRHTFLREKDMTACFERLAYHFILLCGVSSQWLLPYIVALFVGVFSFYHGLQKIILLGSISFGILCLAPLMLTKKHRHHAQLYLHYFFTSSQAEEARHLIKKRMPLFQALFFSSALLCFGGISSYMIYHYFGVDRDTRNTILKWVIAASLSWLAFFFCRSFERFFSEWIWIAISVGMAKTMEDQLNPLSRDKTVVSLLVVSLVMVQCIKQIFHTKEIKSFCKGLSNAFMASFFGHSSHK